jgi:hypothetical protein
MGPTEWNIALDEELQGPALAEFARFSSALRDVRRTAIGKVKKVMNAIGYRFGGRRRKPPPLAISATASRSRRSASATTPTYTWTTLLASNLGTWCGLWRTSSRTNEGVEKEEEVLVAAMKEFIARITCYALSEGRYGEIDTAFERVMEAMGSRIAETLRPVAAHSGERCGYALLTFGLEEGAEVAEGVKEAKFRLLVNDNAETGEMTLAAMKEFVARNEGVEQEYVLKVMRDFIAENEGLYNLDYAHDGPAAGG